MPKTGQAAITKQLLTKGVQVIMAQCWPRASFYFAVFFLLATIGIDWAGVSSIVVHLCRREKPVPPIP
jgi:hypothetical protein